MESPKPVIKEDSIPSTSSDFKVDEDWDFSQFDEDLECPICSDVFIESTTLNCSHTYCKYCITRWMKMNVECPLCRTRITVQVNSLALDHLIDKLMKTRSEDVQKHRKTTIDEREKALSAGKFNEADDSADRRDEDSYDEYYDDDDYDYYNDDDVDEYSYTSSF